MSMAKFIEHYFFRNSQTGQVELNCALKNIYERNSDNWECKTSFTKCDVSCILPGNGITTQIAGRLQFVTHPLYSLTHTFWGLQWLHRAGWCYTVQRTCEANAVGENS